MKSIKQIYLITMMCFLVFTTSVSGVVYVNKNATGANNGNSWADAYTTIQAGINDADVADEEVWVAQGTYTEAITMLSGVKLYGGFNGTETELNQRNWTTNVTTIDASTARGGLPAYHVVIMDNITNATIDGFSITGGNANGGGTNDYGGGIFCYNLNNTNIIKNNTISGNSAKYYGGGIYCYYSSPAITNNTISGNSANYGGGIYCDASSPQITKNTISGNSASYYGGGIHCNASSPAITNNTISGNSANLSGGGGISCLYSSSPAINTNTI
ncbi:MAG: right-handed parallel beta-helix repeat-containing protein, partial [Candidatus Sumerlaeota bacterium]|nr:right-handed parallel beta-helix repeat-containing protein [Candidatus Sumerlaeota bacterium]